ncbi:IucA/IucC family siderophore biosynthesis protein [Streptomyces sp. ISL-12]|uniref:IucA/IucC family siderophore biosynthesis protein n=1 Tax=Streptomyces sp. ISL-12 TaxID=2819177 RepID=UPI001BE92B04|nr:IucA/IucC family siderophore biosynthesis protein [Streptomyces sp. ISL-12]MBT2411925.1 IucA/IucC family siderophore biosynthesis protein [Streptomyces sp. ISL-12]
MHRPPTAEAEIAEELAAVRPGLLPRFTAGLPGARAAVLSRLWRALAHDPLPWIARREPAAEGLVLRLRDGRRLYGPAADPYRTDAYVTTVRCDESEYADPARLMTALAVPGSEGFAAELGHSVASLALSRAGREPGPGWPGSGWEWEQRVVDGHPFHPNCRSRPGFSVAEQLAYAPEHGPVVSLGQVPVPAEECLVSGDWPAGMRDGGRLLLPVHPWQAAHVLKGLGDQAPGRLGEGAVKGLGVGGPRLDAHPLMSLRTLAVAGGTTPGPHVKTALSARLTSSVRDISVASIAASATLSAFGELLAARCEGLLHITRTLGAATAHSPDLAAVLRESPDRYGAPGERVVPVAALATTSLPRTPGWTGRLARLALRVGLRALELGVALEAHGQNLLVVLSPAGEPLRLVYRDLADLRVSPARLARRGIRMPDLPARMVTDDVTVLRRKLFGSLVAGALAGTAGSGPALRAALETAVRDLPRTPDLAALCEEALPAKALTLMRLSPERPGDQWAALPNPLRM